MVRAFIGSGHSRDEELSRLQKENKWLKKANEIVKKRRSLRIRRNPLMAYQCMHTHRSRYAITEMATVVGKSERLVSMTGIREITKTR